MKSVPETKYARSPYEPIAQRVIAFSNARFYGENFSLNPIQLALLNSLDAVLHLKNELWVKGSPVFDAVSMYMGTRAGHSTLWRLVAAALDPEVVLVFPTRDIMDIHQRETGGPIPAPRHALTERQVFAEFSREDGKPHQNSKYEHQRAGEGAVPLPQMPTYPYSVVIFDYAGIWHYNKSPDWNQRFRNALRGLEERQVLTILA